MEVISRKAAKELGLKRFYTGIPCIHGHDRERFVSDGKCLDCNNLKMRKYWESNPEKREERNLKFAERYADTKIRATYLAQRKKKWREDHEWREKQKQKMSDRNAKRYASDKKYRDSIREQSKKYAKENRGIMNARMARRRAAMEQRTPLWSETERIKKLYKKCPHGHHVDHIIPLRGRRVSGLHVLDNLQYLPAKENLSKGSRLLIQA